jgi:hypothetical protein
MRLANGAGPLVKQGPRNRAKRRGDEAKTHMVRQKCT